MFNTKKNNEIRICFLSHSSGNAGAEKAFPKLLEGLEKNGIKIHVLLPTYGPVIEELERRKISFDIIPYRRWLNPDSNFLEIVKRTIRNLLMIIPTIIKIRKWKCNIVYSNTSTICTGAFAAKLMGLTHIWHFREFGFEDYGYNYDLGKKLSYWLTNKLSAICLTNSNAVAQKYKQFIPEEKIKVIYEAYINTQTDINYNSQKFIQKSDINCIIVGTLHQAKGHKDAINAIKELHSAGIKAKLFIVGDGDENYKNDLTLLIKKLNLKDYIEFLGYLDNPQTVMGQCDILLMCSKNEAFGLVTLEAMQIGKPVIGTRSGGTVELILEGYNGLLYNPGNFKELSQKIKYLYDNPEIKLKMGEDAKNMASEKFKPDRYIQETLTIIQELANT